MTDGSDSGVGGLVRPVAWGSAAGRWVLVATVTASGMAFLDGTVVNVALPTIGEEFGAEMSGLQWIVNGYMVTLAALILLSGSLGDRYGRLRVFQLGVVWFAVASAICALAVNTPMLIAARVAQGVGGAMLTPGSLAIIEATFRTEDRARAIGAWSGLTGVATAIGPFLGGWLIDAVSWRAIFLLNLPLAAAVVAVGARHVPESRDPTQARLDVAGAALAALGLSGVTFALIGAGERGGAAPTVVATAVVGVAALVAFAVVERRSRHPMLPPGLFSSPQFTGANLVTAAVYAGLGAVFFLLVIHLQQVLGYTALQAGAASLPITVLMLALSARSGQLAQRLGPRPQMTLGPMVMAVGFLLMVRIDAGDGYLDTVFPAVCVFGFGLAATVAPLTATVLAAADERHAGIASGVNNAVARTAQLAAVAVVPVAAGITGGAYLRPADFTAGFRVAMLITASLAVAGGLLALLTIRRPLRAPVPAQDAAGRPRPPWRHCTMDGTPLHRCPRALDTGGDGGDGPGR